MELYLRRTTTAFSQTNRRLCSSGRARDNEDNGEGCDNGAKRCDGGDDDGCGGVDGGEGDDANDGEDIIDIRDVMIQMEY